MENNFLCKNNTSLIYKKILKDFNLNSLDNQKKRNIINHLIKIMNDNVKLLQFEKIDNINLQSIIKQYNDLCIKKITTILEKNYSKPKKEQNMFNTRGENSRISNETTEDKYNKMMEKRGMKKHGNSMNVNNELKQNSGLQGFSGNNFDNFSSISFGSNSNFDNSLSINDRLKQMENDRSNISQPQNDVVPTMNMNNNVTNSQYDNSNNMNMPSIQNTSYNPNEFNNQPQPPQQTQQNNMNIPSIQNTSYNPNEFNNQPQPPQQTQQNNMNIPSIQNTSYNPNEFNIQQQPPQQTQQNNMNIPSIQNTSYNPNEFNIQQQPPQQTQLNNVEEKKNNVEEMKNNVEEMKNNVEEMKNNVEEMKNNFIYLNLNLNKNESEYRYNFNSINNITKISLISYSLPNTRYNIKDTNLEYLFIENEIPKECNIEIPSGYYTIGSILNYLNNNNENLEFRLNTKQKVEVALKKENGKENDIITIKKFHLKESEFLNKLGMIKNDLSSFIKFENLPDLRLPNKINFNILNLETKINLFYNRNNLNYVINFKEPISLDHLEYNFMDDQNNIVNFHGLNYDIYFEIEIINS